MNKYADLKETLAYINNVHACQSCSFPGPDIKHEYPLFWANAYERLARQERWRSQVVDSGGLREVYRNRAEKFQQMAQEFRQIAIQKSAP